MKTHPLFSQSWSEVTSGERNEIVFENLNHNYGAYEIRRNYDRTLLKAFSVTATLIILLSAYLLISSLFKKAEIIIPPSTDATIIICPPKTNEPIIPKPIEHPITHSSAVNNQNLQPEVSDDHSHDIENIIPRNTNSTSTGTATDTTGIEMNNFPHNGGGEPTLPVDTFTHPPFGLEKMPGFPGGDEKLYAFLKNNLRIPQEIIESGAIREKVGIAFVIDKDGSITRATIIQKGSRYTQLNNEAMRVINLMPKWEPGLQNGKPVKVQMVLPIRFEVK